MQASERLLQIEATFNAQIQRLELLELVYA